MRRLHKIRSLLEHRRNNRVHQVHLFLSHCTLFYSSIYLIKLNTSNILCSDTDGSVKLMGQEEVTEFKKKYGLDLTQLQVQPPTILHSSSKGCYYSPAAAAQ